MNATVEINATGLNQLIGELQDAMIAYGDEADFRKLMRDQAGILAKEISLKLGPKTQAAGEKKLESVIGKAFTEITVPVFPQSKRGGGKGPLQFMFASSDPNYLVGVDGKATITSTMSAAELAKQSRRSMGVKWEVVGRRGKQRVVKLNRYLVQLGRKNQLLDALKNRIGRMRATFAYAAAALGRKDTPGWVSRHFSAVRSEGRAIFDMAKLKDKDQPQIVFGSRVPGIENFADMVQEAVDNRSRKVAERAAGIIKAIGRRDNQGYQPEP